MIDWSTHGPYKINYKKDSDQAESITHKPTNCTRPISFPIVITKLFKMVSAWSDFECTLVYPPASYPAAGFFKPATKDKEGEGPHKIGLANGKSEAFLALANTITPQTAAANTGAASTSLDGGGDESPAKKFKSEVNTQKKRTSMGKAREALASKKNEIDTARIVDL